MKLNRISVFMACVLAAGSFVACEQEIDNSKSRHEYALEVTASTESIVLNEDTPDEDALIVTWTPAADHGDDFIITYKWMTDIVGGVTEIDTGFDDFGDFSKTYTHKELHDLLIANGVLTSSNTEIRFEVEATYDGSYLVVPDAGSVTVKVKTYGDKQFLADNLYLSGTAVGEDIELTPNASNASLYVYNGPLGVGEFNFSAFYQDEHNAFAPAGGQDIDIDADENAMDIAVVDFEGAASWQIAEAKTYRVSLNLETRQVTVQDAANILEMDALYLAGTAVGEEEIKIEQTLENESLYAWRGELQAGAFYIPIEFEESRTVAIVNSAETEDFTGNAVAFAQTPISSASSKAWNVTTAGTYRIVVDIDAKTIKIYDAENDLQPKMTGSWNGDAAGYGNPCDIPVECLWMYGTFKSRLSGDSGLQVGFFNQYRCLQSLADPQVFVYYGDVLPLNTSDPFYPGKDGSKNAPGGSVVFYVGPETKIENEEPVKDVQPWNNSYAFGSTADAVRNQYCGYVTTSLGTPAELVGGQSHNRYAYFIIPDNCNFVIVDIRNMQVTFNKR